MPGSSSSSAERSISRDVSKGPSRPGRRRQDWSGRVHVAVRARQVTALRQLDDDRPAGEHRSARRPGRLLLSGLTADHNIGVSRLRKAGADMTKLDVERLVRVALSDCGEFASDIARDAVDCRLVKFPDVNPRFFCEVSHFVYSSRLSVSLRWSGAIDRRDYSPTAASHLPGRHAVRSDHTRAPGTGVM